MDTRREIKMSFKKYSAIGTYGHQGGKGSGSGRNWEIRIDIYTLCIK